MQEAAFILACVRVCVRERGPVRSKCVRVYVRVRACVCTSLRDHVIRVRGSVRACLNMHEWMSGRLLWAFSCVCMHACVRRRIMSACMHVCSQVWACVCLCVRARMCAFVSLNALCVHVLVNTYWCGF